MSFCDAEEIPFLKDIHKLITIEIPVNEEHPYPMSPQSMVAKAEAAGSKSGGQKRSRGFGNKDKGRGSKGATAGSGMSGASKGSSWGRRGGRRD